MITDEFPTIHAPCDCELCQLGRWLGSIGEKLPEEKDALDALWEHVAELKDEICRLRGRIK